MKSVSDRQGRISPLLGEGTKLGSLPPSPIDSPGLPADRICLATA
ncbi:hypothetical protein [Leptolyngbya ohadii]|nr:hypothetical protein [Leptolyngbya ohadii]